MYLIKRNKTYHLYYYGESGKPITKSTKCTSKSDANKFAQGYLESIKNREPDIIQLTLGEYHKFYKGYASTRFTVNYRQFVNYAFLQFGRIVPDSKLLKDIKTSDIESFIALKLTEAKEQIINGYLRTLQAAFQRGVELGYLHSNVFLKIKKLKYAVNQPVFITEEEFEEILKNESDEQLRQIYTFAFYTGTRKAEIRFLQWDSIDLKKNLINIKNHHEFTTKSKRSRIIPIHPKLITMLTGLNHEQDKHEYVFMRNDKVMNKYFLSKRFSKAVALAGLDGRIHFHTLRHSFASNLVGKEVSIYVVSKLLGHAQVSTTQVYAHLSTESLERAINTL